MVLSLSFIVFLLHSTDRPALCFTPGSRCWVVRLDVGRQVGSFTSPIKKRLLRFADPWHSQCRRTLRGPIGSL